MKLVYRGDVLQQGRAGDWVVFGLPPQMRNMGAETTGLVVQEIYVHKSAFVRAQIAPPMKLVIQLEAPE